MWITVLANNDFPSNYALNLLIRDLSGHNLTIFLSDRVGAATDHPQPLKDLELFERSLLSNNALLSFEEIAQKIGKAIRTLNWINTADDFNIFKQSQPDLVISIRYGVILKDVVISVPQYGVINLHSGVLPDYKGVMPTFRAMLKGEQAIGTTLHYIRDSSIDTGPVIGTTRLPVDRQRSYLWHVLNLYADGCKLVVDTVKSISTGVSVDANDQTLGGSYYSFPSEDDLDAFRKAGLKLFDGDEIVEFARLYVAPEEEKN